MKLKILILVICSIVFIPVQVNAEESTQPTKLSVNLLTHTDRVFSNGYPVNVPLYEAIKRKENFQFAEIAQRKPFFGWIVNSEKRNILQTAYQVLVASSLDNIKTNRGDMWDSGKVQSSQSINISYSGKALKPDSVYFWKVKTWNNLGEESPYSEISQFKMATTLSNYATARYPLQKQDIYPQIVKSFADTITFIDFGKDAFGRIRITLFGESASDTVTIHLGEAQKDGRINRSPGGTIRYASYKFRLLEGWNTYMICITPDKRNTLPITARMPEYVGEVLPFRYCEVEGYKKKLSSNQIVQEAVFYPIDETESYFVSSDTVLNQIWNLCKYTVKATSYAGIYVDSDRERIPYEGDGFINQLANYGVAREYSIGRYSYEYMINHPTWPTEWIMHSVLMAWYDYLYTGNKESLSQFYNDLKNKTLIQLADEDGFISTNHKEKVTPQMLRSIKVDHPEFGSVFAKPLRDLVDWPQPEFWGRNKGYGETDGFVFTDINTVVNAYHYRSLVLMGRIAESLGELHDQQKFVLQAKKLKNAFNNKLLDKTTGLYLDGLTTDHKSLHSNLFPLAFGLASDKNTERIFEFIQSRGMACYYGALSLLSALYENNYAEYGLELLTSISERSWYNMIRSGSTITMEAWDNKFKPNIGWNQPAGATPAYIIPGKLMGIEPLEPGFKKFRIKPQPASLEAAEIKYPTIQGDIFVSFQNKVGESFILEVTIPANTTADIYLPFFSKDRLLLQNGKKVQGKIEGSFVVLENIGSGNNRFEVAK
ncbi:MAG: alpha-L-rhamnosidase C-terminal domain-containing protein [Mangrovibacterium sp.]